MAKKQEYYSYPLKVYSKNAKKIRKSAATNNRSLNDEINTAIEYYLNRGAGCEQGISINGLNPI